MAGLDAVDPSFAAWLIAGLLATGLAAGVLAGLLGVGGGIVIVPVLYSVLSALGVDETVRTHVAVATSLATIIPTSIASARAHARKGAVDWSLARALGPWNFIGAAFGAVVAVSIDGQNLGRVFGIAALIVAFDLARHRPAEAIADPEMKTLGAPIAAPLGTAIGFVSALMGIGGGTLAVPALRYLGVGMHRAVATSATLGLVIAAPSAIGFIVGGQNVADLPPFSIGYVNAAGFVIIATATFMTASIGSRLAHALSARALRLVFAAFLTVTAARMLIAG